MRSPFYFYRKSHTSLLPARQVAGHRWLSFAHKLLLLGYIPSYCTTLISVDNPSLGIPFMLFIRFNLADKKVYPQVKYTDKYNK